MGSVSYKEKKTLPGLDANVPAFGCVTALGPEGPISAAEFWNINQIPFRSERGCRTIAAIDMHHHFSLRESLSWTKRAVLEPELSRSPSLSGHLAIGNIADGGPPRSERSFPIS